MGSWLLIQAVFVPLAAGLVILAVPTPRGGHAGWVAVGALVYTSLVLAWTGVRVWVEGQVAETWALGPDMGLNLVADGLSLPIALTINLICLLLAVYSLVYVDHRIRMIYVKPLPGGADDPLVHRLFRVYRKRFFFLYLFFPTGFMGVALCTNLLAVYLFMEVLTIIPLYFIMAQFGYSDLISRFKVALICLFWGIAGASFFLLAIVMAQEVTGSFEIAAFSSLSGHPKAFWVILVMLLGLGTKLAVLPLHVWMPWVHAEHPTCIAGLLAIYANVAVYILVRVLVIPLGPDLALFQVPIMALALATMVYGALLTLAQTDVKRFCACSTISQISYSVFGVMTLTPMGIQGGIFYFISHVLGKALLFSTAGILVYRTGTRDLCQMGGLGRKMPVTCLLWMAAAMVLSALPPFCGFVGKWLFFAGGFQALGTDLPGAVFMTGAVLSTLLTLIYTFKTGFSIFWGHPAQGQIQDAPLAMGGPLLILALLGLTLGLFPGPVLSLLTRVIPGL